MTAKKKTPTFYVVTDGDSASAGSSPNEAFSNLVDGVGMPTDGFVVIEIPLSLVDTDRNNFNVVQVSD